MGEGLFLFCEDDVDGSEVSRWVDVTIMTLVNRTHAKHRKRTLLWLDILRFIICFLLRSDNTLIRRNNVVVNAFVEFLYGVVSVKDKIRLRLFGVNPAQP